MGAGRRRRRQAAALVRGAARSGLLHLSTLGFGSLRSMCKRLQAHRELEQTGAQHTARLKDRLL